MSLLGVKVALTASRERCEAIAFLLEDEGARLQHLPLLELLPPRDPRPFAALVEQPQRHRWILLSSLEAVAGLWEGARVAGTLGLLGKTGLIAADPAVARMLGALGQPPRIELDPIGPTASLRAALQTDEEVLVPLGEGDSPWPARVAEAGGLPIPVLAWRPVEVELPAEPPELIVFDRPGAASALERDRRPWLQGAVRVAGSAATAEELSRLGTPAHAVAAAGSLGLLEAAQSAWKR